MPGMNSGVNAGNLTLAAGPRGRLEALAASGGTLTAWWLPPAASRWELGQQVRVSIAYGSSG